MVSFQNQTSPAVIELQTRFPGGRQELLAKFNPTFQARYCRDISRVYFGEAPSLGLVRRAYGDNTAESWLEIQIEDLVEYAGCKGKLTKTRITELAAMMLNRYGHYKMTEFMLFFQRFKAGDFDHFYGTIDPIRIFQALRQFDIDRCYAIDRHRAEEERLRRDAEAEEFERLRQRYITRVPQAFTEQAPITFFQYRIMGFDSMTDRKLRNELVKIINGERKLPTDFLELLEAFKQ